MALKNLKCDDKDPSSENWSGVGFDPNVEPLWAEEAERRYQEYLDGKVEAVPGEEALRRIRTALR